MTLGDFTTAGRFAASATSAAAGRFREAEAGLLRAPMVAPSWLEMDKAALGSPTSSAP